VNGSRNSHASSIATRTADPARDLEVEHRQRDRDAGPAVEHVGEEAVARIVVVVGVAAEPEALEQAVADRARASDAAVRTRDFGSGVAGDRVELFAIQRDIALRIVPGADQERGMVEREVIARHHLGKVDQTRARIHELRE
jgi:hypothetical protein